ncbi:MAG TPA: hypothetical protein VGD78_03725 [Chthoniobacterales bacterium]
MLRFLLTVSVICAFGAGALGLFNREKLTRVTQDLAAARQESERAKQAAAGLGERLRLNDERQTGELNALQDQQQKASADLTRTRTRLNQAVEQLDAREKENRALTAALAEAGRNVEQKQRAENERNALAGRLVRVEDTLNQLRISAAGIPAGTRTALPLPIEGSILSMNPDAQALTISLGTDSGIGANARLEVIRNGQGLRELRVVSAERDSCVAEFVTSAPENFAKVAVGDLVVPSTR